MNAVATEILHVLAWGLIATAVLIALTLAAQNMGWSRLNFPLLLGTCFTGRRASATLLGFMLYVLFGWLISFFYFLLFSLIGGTSLLLGVAAGLVHGLLFLAVLLPLLLYVHPRMASEFDGPSSMRRLEPLGFLALHYGSRTPVVFLAAYAAYGAILGWGFR